METKIGPNTNKPFRGLTTIQLFDKNTGELLNEYHDENTYNDRLQYINYINGIISCKGPNIANNVTTFSKLLSDEQNRTFIDTYAYSTIGTTGGTYGVKQLFGTLLLTDSTNAEDAHGYFNGIPVGISDAAGTDAVASAYSCEGLFNPQESFIGNDRLHLVFDFATDKCNRSFDALWLLPSPRRTGQDSALGQNYYVTKPFQASEIASDNIDFRPFTYGAVNKSYGINGNYSVITYGENTGENSTVMAICIINNQTGELIISYSFATGRLIGAPFFYDAGTSMLYCMYAPEGTYAQNVLDPNNKTRDYVMQINLATGVVSTKAYLYDLFGLSFATFNYASNQNTYTKFDFVFEYLNDGSVYLMLRHSGKDAATLDSTYYVVFFSFDPATFTFSQIRKHQVYVDPVADSSIFCLNNLLYTALPTRAFNDRNYYTVFDALTGAIKSDEMMSLGANFLNGIAMAGHTVSDSTNTGTILYACYDQAMYRRSIYQMPIGYLAMAKMTKKQYITSVWSTHNKLATAVNKTSLTTMKIQYDIVWDSLTEVILPALR